MGFGRDQGDHVGPVQQRESGVEFGRKWMYFLSDRVLKTTVQSPWGPRQPEPLFDQPLKIYQLALMPGLRSPFLPPDELHPDRWTPQRTRRRRKSTRTDRRTTRQDRRRQTRRPTRRRRKTRKTDDKKDEKKPPEVKIDFDGSRIAAERGAGAGGEL